MRIGERPLNGWRTLGAGLSLALLLSAGAASAWGTKAKPSNIVSSSAPESRWRAPTSDERAAALRGEPLVRATFFARLFEHNPRDFEAGLILSDSLRQLGRYSEAADVAHRILVLKPDQYEALLAASRAHIADNNAFSAVDLLQQAAALKTNDWRPWSLLGVAYDQISRSDEATQAFDKALKLSPDNPTVLTNIAMSLSTKGRFAEAEPLLRKAVAQKGASKQMRQNLALVLGLQGKYPEAETWLRQDLPPEAVQQNLAWIRNKGGAATTSEAQPGQSHSWDSLKGGS